MSLDDNGWFTSGASYWLDIYQAPGLDAQIYRQRLSTSLKWIDKLALRPGSSVLDAGSGAGHLAAALASRGAKVVASDLSSAMTELTRDRVRRNELSAGVIRSDAHQLAFRNGAFQCVVALGLLPWVQSQHAVVRELARVTAPGGFVILSFDNAARLFRLLDPKLTPATEPLRRLVRQVRPRAPRGNRLVTPQQARELVVAEGLCIVETAGVGFGPPTLLGRPLGPSSLHVRIDAAFQRRVDRRPSPLSRVGAQYLVLARRSKSSP